ncbi:MAG: hypothetical protein HRU03_06985 [Nanoarchaeales archaeon]|nr:hypothetical protein [Nanoarchaeales archaeon]
MNSHPGKYKINTTNRNKNKHLTKKLEKIIILTTLAISSPIVIDLVGYVNYSISSKYEYISFKNYTQNNLSYSNCELDTSK